MAEGIETEEQLRYARETGFTNVQGFVLCKPMPADQLLQRMRGMATGDAPVEGDRRRA